MRFSSPNILVPIKSKQRSVDPKDDVAPTESVDGNPSSPPSSSTSEEDTETHLTDGTAISPMSATQQPANQLTLPAELWQVVFLHAITRPKHLWNRKLKSAAHHRHEHGSIAFGFDQILVVRLVCQPWDTMVLSMPEVWSAVLDPDMGESQFNLCVRRAKECKTLRVCTDRATRSSWGLSPSRWDAIRERMGRTAELCLALNDEDSHFLQVGLLTQVLEEPAPELERLALQCTADFCSTLFDNSAVKLRELTLIGCSIAPQSCYLNLTTLHIESKDHRGSGPGLKLAHVAEWVSLCVKLPLLGSLRLIGVRYGSVGLPEGPSLPSSLKDFAFSGDLASCQWISGISLPMSCNIDLSVDIVSPRWDVEPILRDVVRWASTSLDPNATLSSIDITVKDSNGAHSCVVKRASKAQSVTISTSLPDPPQRALRSVFSGLSRVIVPGSPIRCPSPTLVDPDTWLQFDIEAVQPDRESESYNEVLALYLRSLEGLQNVHVRNFSKRFVEYRDKLIPPKEFNPYDALGLFRKGKGGPLLFPHLRRVRFDGFHESQSSRLLAIGQFVYIREALSIGRRRVEALELVLREKYKKRDGAALSVVLERGVHFDRYVQNGRRSEQDEGGMFAKKVKRQLAGAFAKLTDFTGEKLKDK